MTTAPKVEQSVVDGLERIFDREVASIAARLRRAAVDVERHGAARSTNLNDLRPDYSRDAREIMRDLRVLAGHLEPEGVVKAAFDLDFYLRIGESDG